MTMSNAKQLKVTGMTCGHCEIAVRKALQAVPGVVRVVTVDRKKERAVVEGDAVEQALVDAVADAGYTAELLP
jgi:copper chaperone